MTIFELRDNALQRIIELRKSHDLREREAELRQATNDFMLACLAIDQRWPSVIEEAVE